MTIKNKKLILFSCLLFIVFCLLICCPFQTSAKTAKLTDPLSLGEAGIPELIGRVIKAVMGVIGALSLVICVYGGVLLLASAGKSDWIKKGWDVLRYGAIGLVIVLSSYTVVNFIIQGLSGEAEKERIEAEKRAEKERIEAEKRAEKERKKMEEGRKDLLRGECSKRCKGYVMGDSGITEDSCETCCEKAAEKTLEKYTEAYNSNALDSYWKNTLADFCGITSEVREQTECILTCKETLKKQYNENCISECKKYFKKPKFWSYLVEPSDDYCSKCCDKSLEESQNRCETLIEPPNCEIKIEKKEWETIISRFCEETEACKDTCKTTLTKKFENKFSGCDYQCRNYWYWNASIDPELSFNFCKNECCGEDTFTLLQEELCSSVTPEAKNCKIKNINWNKIMAETENCQPIEACQETCRRDMNKSFVSQCVERCNKALLGKAESPLGYDSCEECCNDALMDGRANQTLEERKEERCDSIKEPMIVDCIGDSSGILGNESFCPGVEN